MCAGSVFWGSCVQRGTMMIYIKIDDNTFYDDAIVLVRSFYPRTEVTAYKESDSSSDNQKDKLKII